MRDGRLARGGRRHGHGARPRTARVNSVKEPRLSGPLRAPPVGEPLEYNSSIALVSIDMCRYISYNNNISYGVVICEQAGVYCLALSSLRVRCSGRPRVRIEGL